MTSQMMHNANKCITKAKMMRELFALMYTGWPIKKKHSEGNSGLEALQAFVCDGKCTYRHSRLNSMAVMTVSHCTSACLHIALPLGQIQSRASMLNLVLMFLSIQIDKRVTLHVFCMCACKERWFWVNLWFVCKDTPM